MNIADRIVRWRDEESGSETEDRHTLLCDAETEYRKLAKDHEIATSILQSIDHICGVTADMVERTGGWATLRGVQDLAASRDYHIERCEITKHVYEKNTIEEIGNAYGVDKVSFMPNQDTLLILWGPDAEPYIWMKQMAGKDIGNAIYIEGWDWQRLPARIEAENWWHLCALIGKFEPLARVLYRQVKP